MEEKKNQNSNNIAMVECPFCNKPIEAPDKADVIFTCPNCHKELITYDKVERKKETLRNERIKQEQIYKRYKKKIKWGSIIVLIISLYLYTKNTSDYTYNNPRQQDIQMAVKNYLKQNLDDPDSYKSASWYGFTYNKADKTYSIWHQYRHRNEYNAVQLETQFFTLDSQKNVIQVRDGEDFVFN